MILALVASLLSSLSDSMSCELNIPVCLSVATSDSGAGAGLQADLKTFAANGTYGVTAFAALTAQNPEGVSAIHELPVDFLRSQLEQLVKYYDIGAAKTGMLFSQSLIAETARFFREHSIPLVIDPVMVATSGARLLEPDAIDVLKSDLIPEATLVTPNLDEVAVLAGMMPHTVDEMVTAAQQLSNQYHNAWLIKGGHLDETLLTDLLCLPDGQTIQFTANKISGIHTHGSGCTLSAAITAHLANGATLHAAVQSAHHYLQSAMAEPATIGSKSFINHFPGSSSSCGKASNRLIS